MKKEWEMKSTEPTFAEMWKDWLELKEMGDTIDEYYSKNGGKNALFNP